MVLCVRSSTKATHVVSFCRIDIDVGFNTLMLKGILFFEARQRQHPALVTLVTYLYIEAPCSCAQTGRHLWVNSLAFSPQEQLIRVRCAKVRGQVWRMTWIMMSLMR